MANSVVLDIDTNIYPVVGEGTVAEMIRIILSNG